MGLTQRELGDAIRVPYQRVNEIVNGRRGIVPSTGLRLAKYFGPSPDLWSAPVKGIVYSEANAHSLRIKEVLNVLPTSRKASGDYSMTVKGKSKVPSNL